MFERVTRACSGAHADVPARDGIANSAIAVGCASRLESGIMR